MRWMDGWMVDGWMDGWMEWMDGWMVYDIVRIISMDGLNGWNEWVDNIE